MRVLETLRPLASCKAVTARFYGREEPRNSRICTPRRSALKEASDGSRCWMYPRGSVFDTLVRRGFQENWIGTDL